MPIVPKSRQWVGYYYLDDKIAFPFQGKLYSRALVSPLKMKEVVEVISMAPEDECEREMFVVISWMDRKLAVPLVQIEGIDVDAQTEEAIGDWHYWIVREYELGD